jgi:long-subunit fatty acid transport protein
VGAFNAASVKYALNSNLLEDQEADVTQSGWGITPFFSINISPLKNLNIAVKYEMATKLELQNETATDLLIGYTMTGTPITMFPDGEKLRNDMPALLTVGAELQLAKLKLALGGNYYFDKSADYGHKIDHDIDATTPTIHISNSEIIEKNGMSIQAGFEYKLSDLFLVSSGYSYANKGVNSLYQSDLTYGLATHTFGIGGAVTLTDMIRINIGGSFTSYVSDSKRVNHKLGAINMLPEETYKKNTMVIGVGVDFSF